MVHSNSNNLYIDGYNGAPISIPTRNISSARPFKSMLFSVLMGLVFTGLFSFGVYVFAIPPASPYAPGETLNPLCSPGTANCTVNSPVYFTGSILDVGSYNFSGGTPLKIKYNSSNYATLTVGSNGDLTIAATSSGSGGNIKLNSPTSSNATLLSDSGILVLGGGIAGDESLNFDFHDYADKVVVTSSTGVSSIDFGSLNLVTAGTLTLGGSTTGTLVTRITAGSPTESDTNGSLVVDSANGRLYFRYGNSWHYVAQTGGFQIPNFETVDPISGEEIVEGDFVVGLIDKSLDDNALHGVWVRWDTLKQQLINEIQLTGGLTVNSTLNSTTSGEAQGSNVLQDSFLSKVVGAIASVGITIKNGLTSIANLAVENFYAKTAKIDKLEMTDSATGDIYCTWIENGDWKKVKGECGSVQVAVANTNSSQQANRAIQEAADKAVQKAAEKIDNKIKEKVETEVKQQLENQQTVSLPPKQTSLDNSEPLDSNQGEQEKNKIDKGKEIIAEEVETQEQSPTIIDILVENSTSALLDRMNSLIKSVMENFKGVPQSLKEFSVGFMEPLKDIFQTLFIEPASKVSKAINPATFLQQVASNLYKTSSATQDLSLSVAAKTIEDLKTIAKISKLSQNNLLQSSLSFSQKTYDNFLQFKIAAAQSFKEAWIFNPIGLVRKASLDIQHTFKLIQTFNLAVTTKMAQDLAMDAEISRLSKSSLIESLVSLADQAKNVFIELLNLLKEFIKSVGNLFNSFNLELKKNGEVIFDTIGNGIKSLWIFNPSNLVKQVADDFSKNMFSLSSFGMRWQSLTKNKVESLSLNVFSIVQNFEVKTIESIQKISKIINQSSASLFEGMQSFISTIGQGVEMVFTNTQQLSGSLFQEVQNFELAALRGIYQTSAIFQQSSANLLQSSINFKYNAEKSLAGVLESVKSAWIFNPVNLIKFGAGDLQNNFQKLQNLY